MTVFLVCVGAAGAVWLASKSRNKTALNAAIGAGYLVLGYCLVNAVTGLGRFF